MNFNLTKIRPKAFLHSSGFNEVMDSLAWSLTALGHTATITDNWIDRDRRNIIFGAELLSPNQPEPLPPGTILYNLEQPSHPNMAKVKAIASNCRLTVWDYSKRSFLEWKEMGVDARYVPIGFTPNLHRIPSTVKTDIDILFYGWLTPRRMKIIEDLRSHGVNAVATDCCYGGGRDQLISRSKLCLNIHHDGRDRFEIVRCSYLMSNYKWVISEESADDDEYRDLLPGLTLCPYDKIVDTVVEKLKKIPYGFHAHEAISSRDYTQTVSLALIEPTPQQKVAMRYAGACAEGDMKDFLPWIREHAKGTILEIGVRNGASTSAFLAGVEQNGGVVLSVDKADCGQLFDGHPQWKFLCTGSQNPKLHVPELDILLIDGDHTREGYLADLKRFYPLVKPGGLVLTHDIDPETGKTYEDFSNPIISHYTDPMGNPMTCTENYPSIGIREEYFKFCSENNLRHEELPGKCGFGIMYKPEAVESDESWEASRSLCNAG